MSRSDRPDLDLTSPPWQTGTRLVAAVWLVLVAGVVVYALRALLVPFILALMLAYILHPLVIRLIAWRLPRWAAVAVVYLVVLVLVGGVTTGLGFAISQQILGLVRSLTALSVELPRLLEDLAQTTILLGPFEFDLAAANLEALVGPLQSALQPVIAQMGNLLASLVTATASTLGMLLLILVMAYYLLRDFGQLDEALLDLVPGPYQQDFRRLLAETGKVWQGFLRGQLLLGLVIGVVTWVVFSVAGVRFALGLGVIAGVLEFVPIFGPVIAGLVAVLVALFQPSNLWGLSPWAFALVVAGLALLIQQLENNVLVPRIIGHSLKLHPLIVLLAALGGGIVAGVAGVLLAAPVVATGRLWLGYVYRKAVGLDRWPGPVLAPAGGGERLPLRERLAILLGRRRVRVVQEPSNPTAGEDERT